MGNWLTEKILVSFPITIQNVTTFMTDGRRRNVYHEINRICNSHFLASMQHLGFLSGHISRCFSCFLINPLRSRLLKSYGRWCSDFHTANNSVFDWYCVISSPCETHFQNRCDQCFCIRRQNRYHHNQLVYAGLWIIAAITINRNGTIMSLCKVQSLANANRCMELLHFVTRKNTTYAIFFDLYT